MPVYRKHIITALLFHCLAVIAIQGQYAACPPNIDFEAGNFSNWECRTGRVESIGGVNTVFWEGYSQLQENHKIIPQATAGTDIFGNFSQAPPSGGEYSVKLGNNFHQNISAEGIAYTFSIPDNVSFFSIIYYYAVVFQDPQHNPDEQPRFRATVFNVTDNEVVDCSNFDYTASSSLPGFQVSPVEPSVIYKDWTPVTLNLSAYAGKTIRLEFITSDCTYKGHFGYAYIDVGNSCSSVVKGNLVCSSVNEVVLTAPYGFHTYKWYPYNDFSATIATGQVMVLDPVPPMGTMYSVIVEPYPGFGCTDTVSVTLEGVAKPVANAGPDIAVCKGGSAGLGSGAADHCSYNWSPAALLTSSSVPNPVTVLLDSPASFYLMVTDDITGCVNHDTVDVAVTTVDTALRVNGDHIFCRNEPVTTSLQALSPDGNIQWYENGTAISGATSNVFNPRPLASSTYWATVQNGSCMNFTRVVALELLPVPVADFSTGPGAQCINAPMRVLNKSTEHGNTDYWWEVSDGRTFSSRDIELAFPTPGQVAISLKAVSTEGCRDSITKSIEIIGKCDVHVPIAFTPGDNGRNDWFMPRFTGVLKLRRFTIYDRGGFVVFSTNKIGEGWDGRVKGRAVPTSVLVWILEYETAEGRIMMQKGTVTLIR